MSTSTIVFIVIIVVLVAALVALYFFGKKAQRRQAVQQEQMAAIAQTISMLVIDKKKLKISQSRPAGPGDRADAEMAPLEQASHRQGQGRTEDYDPRLRRQCI